MGMAALDRNEQLQHERDENLALAERFSTSTNGKDQEEILSLAREALAPQMLEIIEHINWFQTYFGCAENFHDTGLLDEIIATALYAMHQDPSRYILLIDYIPDAIFAFAVCDVVECQHNELNEDWHVSMDPFAHGFGHYVSRQEFHDGNQYASRYMRS